MCCSSTIGVLPMMSSTLVPTREKRPRVSFSVSVAMALAASGHGRQNDDRVAVGNRGFEPIQVLDILVVHIDVNVAPQLAVFEKLVAQRWKLLGEVAENV